MYRMLTKVGISLKNWIPLSSFFASKQYWLIFKLTSLETSSVLFLWWVADGSKSWSLLLKNNEWVCTCSVQWHHLSLFTCWQGAIGDDVQGVEILYCASSFCCSIISEQLIALFMFWSSSGCVGVMEDFYFFVKFTSKRSFNPCPHCASLALCSYHEHMPSWGTMTFGPPLGLVFPIGGGSLHLAMYTEPCM